MRLKKDAERLDQMVRILEDGSVQLIRIPDAQTDEPIEDPLATPDIWGSPWSANPFYARKVEEAMKKNILKRSSSEELILMRLQSAESFNVLPLSMLLEPAPSSSRSVNTSLERRTLSISSSTKNLEQAPPTEEEGSETSGMQTVRRMPTKGKGSASSSTMSLHSKKSKGKKGPLSRQGSGPLHDGCFITTPKRMMTTHIAAPEGDEPRPSTKQRESVTTSKADETSFRKSGEEKKEEEEEKRSICEEDKGRSVLN